MKKLINKPENVVREALEGMAYAHSDLIKVHYDPNFIVRADALDGVQVSIQVRRKTLGSQ